MDEQPKIVPLTQEQIDQSNGCFLFFGLVFLAILAVGVGVLVHKFGAETIGIWITKSVQFVGVVAVLAFVGHLLGFDKIGGQVPGWQWQEWHENGGGPASRN